MKVHSTPHRFLPAWLPQRAGTPSPAERTEPVLGLPPIATLQDCQPPQPRLADIERALEEGSRRVYLPRGETEVIEKPRR
ncbi:hypothetical protein [Roseateles sp. LYH14W]|uniref:Uncharacterized protein n=1 Tax=Pelomonas parva TaxID=3299032 RepID=A0ABW7FAM9_9BURK